MKYLLVVTISQFLLLTLLFAKNKNDGEKALFRAQPWTAYDVVLVVSLLNITAYLVYFLSGLKILQPSFNKYSIIIFNFILILLFIYIIRLRRRRIFNILGLGKYNIIQSVLLGIATAVGIWLVFNVLYLAFGRRDDYALNIVNDIRVLDSYFDYTIYVLTVVVVAPITEESLYRGILYSPFRKKYGAIIAIIFNGLLFAASHYGSSIGPFFVTGILFCLLYEKTESIVSCIVAHGVNNMLGIISAFYFMKAI